jgi:hypothetical protein
MALVDGVGGRHSGLGVSAPEGQTPIRKYRQHLEDSVPLATDTGDWRGWEQRPVLAVSTLQHLLAVEVRGELLRFERVERVSWGRPGPS